MLLAVLFSVLVAESSCLSIRTAEEEDQLSELRRSVRQTQFGQFGTTTTSAGDPFLTSFDGLRMEFQGTCSYLLCTPCRGPIKDWWTIEVTNKAVYRRNQMFAYTDNVNIIVYNHLISLKANDVTRIDSVQHTEAELLENPVFLHDNRVEVGALGPGMGIYVRCMEMAFNITHQNKGDDGRHVASLSLMSSDPKLRDLRVYRGNLCGLCGNFNGNQVDDLIPYGSDEVASPVEVGNSYITNKEGCGF